MLVCLYFTWLAILVCYCWYYKKYHHGWFGRWCWWPENGEPNRNWGPAVPFNFHHDYGHTASHRMVNNHSISCRQFRDLLAWNYVFNSDSVLFLIDRKLQKIYLGPLEYGAEPWGPDAHTWNNAELRSRSEAFFQTRVMHIGILCFLCLGLVHPFFTSFYIYLSNLVYIYIYIYIKTLYACVSRCDLDLILWRSLHPRVLNSGYASWLLEPKVYHGTSLWWV